MSATFEQNHDVTMSFLENLAAEVDISRLWGSLTNAQAKTGRLDIQIDNQKDRVRRAVRDLNTEESQRKIVQREIESLVAEIRQVTLSLHKYKIKQNKVFLSYS